MTLTSTLNFWGDAPTLPHPRTYDHERTYPVRLERPRLERPRRERLERRERRERLERLERVERRRPPR
jgi:hypothetical protein